MNAIATVHSNASIVVRPLVLARAVWERRVQPGGVGLRPIKGTWHAHLDKSGSGSSVVVPMLSCPSCAKLLLLAHSSETARVLGRMVRQIVPVAHRIDTVGKVAPDLRCTHPGCSFHRTVYLDKWDRLRPLYVTAYTEGASVELRFAYSHAASQKEARFHLGTGDFNIISVGRAVGVLLDEKSGKVTAD